MGQTGNNIGENIIKEQKEKVDRIQIELDYAKIHLDLLKKHFNSTGNDLSEKSTLQILSSDTSGKGLFLKEIISEYIKLGVITDYRTLYYTHIQGLVEKKIIKVIKLQTTRVRKYKIVNNQQH